MWTWSEDREGLEAIAQFPFATTREARWAAAWLSADIRGRLVTLHLVAESPDSYSPEMEERDRDPDAYYARVRADLAVLADKNEEAVRTLGIQVGGEPATDVQEALVRRDYFRRMPPTRRRVRDATTINAPPAPTVVFCDYQTGEPTERVPVLIGAAYWTTATTIDVARVDEASVAGLRDPKWTDEEVRAFLTLELQYGPLDIPAARARLTAAWLDARDALPAAANETALHNSKTMLARRRGPREYRPWSEDARVLLPE